METRRLLIYTLVETHLMDPQLNIFCSQFRSVSPADNEQRQEAVLTLVPNSGWQLPQNFQLLTSVSLQSNTGWCKRSAHKILQECCLGYKWKRCATIEFHRLYRHAGFRRLLLHYLNMDQWQFICFCDRCVLLLIHQVCPVVCIACSVAAHLGCVTWFPTRPAPLVAVIKWMIAFATIKTLTLLW